MEKIPDRYGNWHIMSVEGNPYHGFMLAKRKALLEDLGHDVHILNPLAVSTINGSITFYLDGVSTYSSSTNPDSRSSTLGGGEISVNTATIRDLCNMVVPGGITEQDYVVIKMDIEGSEYDILLQAIAEGIPARWDELYVEFHEDNYWVFKDTPKEAEARSKREVIEETLQTEFGLPLRIWEF